MTMMTAGRRLPDAKRPSRNRRSPNRRLNVPQPIQVFGSVTPRWPWYLPPRSL